MRRRLNGYLEKLENQVLNDPQCGIFSNLWKKAEHPTQVGSEPWKNNIGFVLCL